jgi:hypothetical protein
VERQEGREPLEAATREGKPSVTMKLAKRRFLLAEPFLVTVEVRNDTNEVIERVYSPVIDAWFALVARGPDGREIEVVCPTGLSPLFRSVSGPVGQGPLQPGESVVSRKIVYRSGLQALFPKPGRYLLKARMYEGAPEEPVNWESGWVKVEIVRPRGVDARAFAAMKKWGGAYSFYDEVVAELPLPEAVETVEKFVSDFEGSVYADYAAVMALSALYKYGERDGEKASAIVQRVAKTGRLGTVEIAEFFQ